MAEYHVGAGITGIYAGRLKKNAAGDGEWASKSDVTDECIHAVMQHLLPEEYDKVNAVIANHVNGRKVKLSCEWIDENGGVKDDNTGMAGE